MNILSKRFIIFLLLLFPSLFPPNLSFAQQLSAPYLIVKDVNGKVFDIDHYENKAVMVLFWAHWCGYCRKEMISLEKIYQHYKNKDLIIIGLSIDRKKKLPQLLEFSKKLSYPIAFFEDAKTNFSNRKNIIPQIQIVNRNRTTIYTISGYVNDEEIINTIDKALLKSN